MKRLQAMGSLVIFLASMFAGGAHGVAILCVEADGRITLESLADKCCNDSPGAQPQTQGGPEFSAPGEDSCGSCVDIPILTDANSTPADRAARARAFAPQSDLAPLSFASDWTAVVFNAISAPPIIPTDPRLAHLRSIVLRF